VFLCSFPESLTQPIELVGEEAQTIGRTASIGSGFVFTSSSEEQFYLTNNLPEQLRQIFASINPRRLDEDALEDACTRGQKLVMESFMLEDFIGQAYLALKNLGLENTVLHVRRPLSTILELGDGRRGALLALKRVWAGDWSFERTLERLDLTGSVGLEARPAYLFAGTGIK
jgi:phosphoenolpyruvate synthase/pyruvate phosphate dikinase